MFRDAGAVIRPSPPSQCARETRLKRATAPAFGRTVSVSKRSHMGTDTGNRCQTRPQQRTDPCIPCRCRACMTARKARSVKGLRGGDFAKIRPPQGFLQNTTPSLDRPGGSHPTMEGGEPAPQATGLPHPLRPPRPRRGRRRSGEIPVYPCSIQRTTVNKTLWTLSSRLFQQSGTVVFG